MNLWRDVRYGARMLAASPGFALATVLTLALGIAANTTIFTVADGVLLRPLAYDEPERIVSFWGGGSWSQGELQFMRDQGRSYENVAAYHDTELVLTDLDRPRVVATSVVSANLFAVLGIEPMLGRPFRMEEETPGKDQVAILGHRLWRDSFGGDRDVVGKTVGLSDQAFEIVGVMPQGFKFPHRDAELWLPITMDPSSGGFRGGRYLDLIARLAPGIRLGEAQGELEALVPHLAEEFNMIEGFDKLATPPAVISFHDQLVGNVRPALLVLLAAVGFVLLIGCANVANLVLARSVHRSREMAIRSALGAGRRAIVGQVLIECGILAIVGGGLGMLLSLWGVDLMIGKLAATSPRVDEIAIDPRVLGFCALISLSTVFLFGLAPALSASRVDLRPLLAEGRRTAGSASRRRMRLVLVVAEMALAVGLVVAGGLLARSFLELTRVDPGFSTENTLSFGVNLATQRYADPAQRVAFYDQTLERLSALPGAQAAGAIWRLPIANGGAYQTLELEGRPHAAGEPVPFIYWRAVAGDYFETMGIPLLDGRALGDRDTAGAVEVCLINQTTAERFFPEGDAVGKRLRNSMDDDRWITVVGVVGDVRHNGLREDGGLMLYRPFAQVPSIGNLSLVVRAGGDPISLAGGVRRAVHEVDPRVPVVRVTTLEQVVDDSVARMKMVTSLVVLFGVVSLALAAIGVFGVLSFSVSQRTLEMGIRMALGAQRGDVLRMMVTQGMAPALIGGAFGVVGALALTRLMAGLLFGVGPGDPLTYLGVAGLLILVALAACYLPARRAARVDPMVALRYE